MLAGLLIAFLSAHYEAKVMGGLKPGDIVLGPEPGSPAAREKQRQRTTADCVFYIGLVITALGVILQTIGAVMPTD